MDAMGFPRYVQSRPFYPFIWITIGCSVIFHRPSFDTVLGHLILIIIHKQRLIKTCSVCNLLGNFPYFTSTKDFPFILKIQTLVLVMMFGFPHIGCNWIKTPLAFLTTLLTCTMILNSHLTLRKETVMLSKILVFRLCPCAAIT